MLEAGDQDSYDVFVSHANEDAERARNLAANLGRAGYRCFVAGDDLNALVGTQKWSEVLDALLASIPALILLVTDRSLRSKWVQYEWRSFHDAILSEFRAGLVVPVLVGHHDLASLPPGLRHWQLIDLDELGSDHGVAKLVELLDGFRAGTVASRRPLDQRLPWSKGAAARGAMRGAGAGAHPRPSRNWWGLRLGLPAICLVVAVAVAVLSWSRIRPRRGEPAGPVPAETLAILTPPATEPAGPPEPRVGWRAIEAFLRPTEETVDFLRRSETWDEAARAFEDACRRGCSARQRAAGQFCGAQRARLAGNVEPARREMQQARVSDPSWSLPALGLSLVEEDPTRAIELARQAYAQDPSLWMALGVKGAKFAQQGNYVAAVEEFVEERRVAPGPSRPLVEAALALVYHAEGLRDGKAEQLAHAACTGESHVAAACAVLAERALERRDPEQALRYVERADLDDYVPLLLAQGDALQMKHDLDRAWRAWNRVLALGPVRGRGAPAARLAEIVKAAKTGRAPPPRLGGRSPPERSRPTIDEDGLSTPSF